MSSAPEEDFPPEPEDAYPPDPQEEEAERPPRPGPQLDRSAADAASTPPAGVEEVEETPRDSVADGEPRTHGQEALRRALETGGVVRGRRRPDATTPGEAASPAPSVDSSALAPASTGRWSDALERAGAAVAPTPPVPATAADEAAPRTGAALAREALRSLHGQQDPRSSDVPAASAPSIAPAAEPDAEVDVTGGASWDDEDAQVTTRNGRDVVEQVLGGKVLEVIDETP